MYPISRRARTVMVVACAAAATGAVTAAVALGKPTVSTDRGCYVVGHTGRLTGGGFAPSQEYTVMVDGVLFGTGTTDSQGGFAVTLKPGPLPSGAAQHVDHVSVSDGNSTAGAFFTLTRKTGAHISAVRGTGTNLTARFQVWGFSLGGAIRRVYLHYIAPSGRPRKTVALGFTRGQCGYLLTSRRRLFPFSPSHGTWTLRFDTRASYARHGTGPVARIRVSIA